MTKQDIMNQLTALSVEFDPKLKKGELMDLLEASEPAAETIVHTEETCEVSMVKAVAVKKAFQPIMDLLTASQDMKVSDIMEQVYQLARAKNASVAGGKTFLKDEDGAVYAIFCYYHKRWELLCEGVEYGKKANTATGLNTMCKDGTSSWTKQQRVAKQAKEALLNKIMSGELKPEDLAAEQQLIEVARGAVAPREDGLGYDEQSEAEEAYANLVNEELV